jgi:aspartate/glutamate racemase
MMIEMHASEIDLIHATYSDIALHGKRGTHAETKLLSEMARNLIGRGAEAIVLAGTDLASFYADSKPDFPFLDAAQLHIDAIMRHISRQPG